MVQNVEANDPETGGWLWNWIAGFGVGRVRRHVCPCTFFSSLIDNHWPSSPVHIQYTPTRSLFAYDVTFEHNLSLFPHMPFLEPVYHVPYCLSAVDCKYVYIHYIIYTVNKHTYRWIRAWTSRPSSYTFPEQMCNIGELIDLHIITKYFHRKKLIERCNCNLENRDWRICFVSRYKKVTR